MNTKPFNLKEIMEVHKGLGITRGGLPCRVLAVVDSKKYPIAVAITINEEEQVKSLTIDGFFYKPHETHSFDMFTPVRKVEATRWANVYSDGVVHTASSRNNADKIACTDRFACVEIKINCEEGDGL